MNGLLINENDIERQVHCMIETLLEELAAAGSTEIVLAAFSRYDLSAFEREYDSISK